MTQENKEEVSTPATRKAETSRLWKLNNPTRVKEYKRAWVLKNKDKVKEYRKTTTSQMRRKHAIKVSYSITWNEYESLYKKYHGVCGICKIKLSLSKDTELQTAAIDHCHTTGKIRGILCRNCNLAIGYLQDSVDLLKQATQYLNEHNAEKQ